MLIRIGGGEELNSSGESDTVSVHNPGDQKPPVSTPSISSSDSLKASSGQISLYNSEEEDENEWVAVEREAEVLMPEIEEVDDALSSLKLMFNEEEEESEEQDSDLKLIDWIEPPLDLCNSRLLQPYMLDRLYDAFHLFQTDPSVQRIVMSLASDRAVWDAVMNNEVVRELVTNAEKSEEEPNNRTCFIRNLFEKSATKIYESMEIVTKYVTDLFNVVPEDETVVLATAAAPLMEKLQMSVLLAIVVMLIVLVTRATKAR